MIVAGELWARLGKNSDDAESFPRANRQLRVSKPVSSIFLFPSNYIRLSFDLHPDRFSVGDELRPVDLAASDHGAIFFDSGT